MKSMKLFVGLVAAVALSTGCGGSYAEDACERAQSISKEMADTMEACMPELGDEGEVTDAEMEACVESMESCSEEEVETALDWMDCYANTFSCEALEDPDAAQDALDAMAACDAKYDMSDLSLGCQNAVDVEASPTVRKAMQLKARQ